MRKILIRRPQSLSIIKKPRTFSLNKDESGQKILCLNCQQYIQQNKIPSHSLKCIFAKTQFSSELKLRNFYSIFQSWLEKNPYIQQNLKNFIKTRIQAYYQIFPSRNERECLQLNNSIHKMILLYKKHSNITNILKELLTIGELILQQFQQTFSSTIVNPSFNQTLHPNQLPQTSDLSQSIPEQIRPDARSSFNQVYQTITKNYPITHPCHSVPSSFLFKNCSYLGIKPKDWKNYLQREFDTFQVLNLDLQRPKNQKGLMRSLSCKKIGL